MTNDLNTIAEELRTTAISKLPEAISVSEGDCILVVQNRKAKRARPSLFRGPKGDTGMTGATGAIGAMGASPVLRYTTRGIESKLSNQPDTEFTLLVPIADMTGPQGTTGANIVLRAGDTGIEFKLSTEPDSAYKVLVPYLQITGPKGDTGPAPILELGEVTTVEPSDPASATFQPNGVDPSGANKYRLALSIPKGKSGQDGTGAGNVLVNNEASLLASKQYAFKPGQDGSVNGAFVEFIAPDVSNVPEWAMQPEKPSYNASDVGAIPSTDKGKANGVASLDSEGKVPDVQLPSFVGDAPLDGIIYGRKDGRWAKVESNSAYFIPQKLITLIFESTGEPASELISDAIGGVEGFNKLIDCIKNGNEIIFRIDDSSSYGTRYYDSLVKSSDMDEIDNGKRCTINVDLESPYNVTLHLTIMYSENMFFMALEHEPLSPPITIEGLVETLKSQESRQDDYKAIEYAVRKSRAVLHNDTTRGSYPISIYVDLDLERSINYFSINGAKSVSENTIHFHWGTLKQDGTQTEKNNVIAFNLPDHQGSYDAQITFEGTGDGTKFLSNDGTYKAISSGAGNIYHLDLDISGYMSRATEAEQTAIWGKMYTAPTNENIITLLGGAEGIRQLCEKLKPTNNPIVTVPYMLYFLPTRLLSTSVSILIADSTSLTNILSSPQDGCYINIALMFYTRINDPISIMVNLIIANFNTDTQQVSYEYLENTEFVHIEDSLNSSSTSDALSANQGGILKERIDKKVGSEEITTIKKLTQAAYDALSPKDTKTLYACIQSNGTIVMRLPL